MSLDHLSLVCSLWITYLLSVVSGSLVSCLLTLDHLSVVSRSQESCLLCSGLLIIALVLNCPMLNIQTIFLTLSKWYCCTNRSCELTDSEYSSSSSNSSASSPVTSLSSVPTVVKGRGEKCRHHLSSYP